MEAALDAGREVVVVAAGTLTPALALERHADLVVLGWSPWLSPRRAGAVRPFLECPPAPVALLPVPARRWR